jgi:membrane associated rhomboid family serine protease
MFEAFSKAQWKTTLIFFVVCGALAAAAGVVGMDDNPVGGALAWLSAIALVLAVAHPWRTSRRFLLLTGASVLAFIACTLLSVTLENAGIGGGGVFFLIAIFVCPAALVVGIIGAVVTWVTSRRAHHAPPARPVS